MFPVPASGYHAKAYVKLFVNLTEEFRYALLTHAKIQLIKVAWLRR